MRFGSEFIVDTHAKLRARVGPFEQDIAAKAIDHIDPYCAAFIRHVPLALVATRRAEALLDIPPKDDRAVARHHRAPLARRSFNSPRQGY